jgi:hypothetical protein
VRAIARTTGRHAIRNTKGTLVEKTGAARRGDYPFFLDFVCFTNAEHGV